MKYEIARSDLNEDTLQYEVNMNDPSYITWITSGAGGSFEDSSEWYEEDTNEYTTTALQEGAFTNDNQNYYDKILAESAEYNTSNVTNECFTAPPSLQNTRNFSGNSNIKKSTEKDIVNETSDEKIPQDRNNLDVYSRIPESYTPEEKQQDSIPEQNNNMQQLSNMLEKDDITVEDPNYLHELILEEDSEKLEKIEKKIKKLNQQELLLQNEEQELLELLDQLGPPDNMRNRKKPKTYDYNLSLQDLQKDKSKLLNIDNGGKAFFFSYL